MNTDALRQWVADKSGLTAIWQNPNAPRPDRPYATVQIISSPRIGPAYVGPISEDGEVIVTGQREAVVSIQIHERADNANPRAALDRATALRDALDLPTSRETLKDNGWAFRSVELLTDTPQIDGTEWQPRATFDVRFGVAVQLEDDLGRIETIELTHIVSQGALENPIFEGSSVVNIIHDTKVGEDAIKLSDKDGNILSFDDDGNLYAAPKLQTRNW